MKKLFLLGAMVSALILASCSNKGNYDTTEDLAAWYNDVLLKDETDTVCYIPEYAYSTDWMQRYVQYIKENFESPGGDIWFSNDTVEGFDCRYWTMAYVDNDTIPEMLLYGGCWASGSIILTQYGGEVHVSPRGCFSYIKSAGGLLHSHWMRDYDVWGEIYEIKNGKFTEMVNYSLNTDYVDTSRVSKYGLTLDSLKCDYADGVIGDSVVSISSIELNGKRIGACFYYGQYVNCTGFAKLKQALESLYYTKGTSTFFPFTPEKMTINNLIKATK